MNTDTRALGIDIGSTTTKLVFIENEKNNLRKNTDGIIRRCRKRPLKCSGKRGLIWPQRLAAAISGPPAWALRNGRTSNLFRRYTPPERSSASFLPRPDLSSSSEARMRKLIFFNGGIDERMNGSLRRRNGRLYRPDAVLLNMSVTEMDRESLKSTKLYPIASRCGVFAKTDIQALLNQSRQGGCCSKYLSGRWSIRPSRDLSAAR